MVGPAAGGVSVRARPSPTGAASRYRRTQLVRVASHATVWGTLLIPTFWQMSRGWRALGDDATISLRSYEVFSSHSPLVGMFSTTSVGSAHAVFDPGPLQFWLLAIPVRIDPAQGALWGAAVACGAVLSLAVEALLASRATIVALGVTLLVVDVAWLTPEIFADPTWDPNLSFLFLVATLALAYVVALGSMRWWPWLVLVASITVQSEFFYFFIAFLAVVLAPCVGFLGRPRSSRRWLAVGALVLGACWLAPVAQQITGNPGNLLTLLRAPRVDPLGASYALRSLALAADPRPLWTVHYAALINNPTLLTGSRSAVGGALVLFLTATTVLAWATRRHRLALLSGLGVAMCVGLGTTVALVPRHLYLNLVRYFLYFLWPLSLLTWVVVIWVVGELARRLASRTPAIAWTRQRAHPRVPAVGAISLSVAVVGSVTALTTYGIIHAVQTPALAARNEITSPPSKWVTLDRQIVSSVEHAVARGPVFLAWCVPRVSCPVEDFAVVKINYHLGAGANWQLSLDGWTPTLSPWFTQFSGLAPHRHAGWPIVSVHVTGGDQVAVKRVTSTLAHRSR